MGGLTACTYPVRQYTITTMSDDKTSRYVAMPAAEIVKALGSHAQPGSHLHEEIKGALPTVLVKSLTDSIDRHERAASVVSLK